MGSEESYEHLCRAARFANWFTKNFNDVDSLSNGRTRANKLYIQTIIVCVWIFIFLLYDWTEE